MFRRGELRDDACGLAHSHQRDRCKHHAGGDEGVELGHSISFRVVFSHLVQVELGDDLRGLVQRGERDGGQQKSCENEAVKLGHWSCSTRLRRWPRFDEKKVAAASPCRRDFGHNIGVEVMPQTELSKNA